MKKNTNKQKVHVVHSCVYYRDKGISCTEYHVKSCTCIGTRCGHYLRHKELQVSIATYP